MTDPYAPPGEPTTERSDLPTSDKVQTLLVLAGVSFLVCGPFTAVPGWFMARAERARMARGEIAEDSSIDVAYWLFVANLILFVLSMVFAAGMMLWVVWAFDTHGLQ